MGLRSRPTNRSPYNWANANTPRLDVAFKTADVHLGAGLGRRHARLWTAELKFNAFPLTTEFITRKRSRTFQRSGSNRLEAPSPSPEEVTQGFRVHADLGAWDEQEISASGWSMGISS